MRCAPLASSTLSVAILFVGPTCLACSCDLESIDAVYERSAHVWLAKVVRVDMLTKRPKHNEIVTYRAYFEPLEVLKGNPPDRYSLKYKGRYQDPTGDVITVGGCYSSFEVGEEYLLLKRRGRKVRPGWCSSEIHPKYRVRFELVRELGKEVQDR